MNCGNLDMGLRSEIFEFKDLAEYNIRAYKEILLKYSRVRLEKKET